MKTLLPLICALLLVPPARGQEARPDLTDPTVLALKALLPLKQRSDFGVFLARQSRFARIADRELLLRAKAEAERPNYGGNAYAAKHRDFWISLLRQQIQIPPAEN